MGEFQESSSEFWRVAYTHAGLLTLSLTVASPTYLTHCYQSSKIWSQLSGLDPAKTTGQLLCLNANYTSYISESSKTNPAVARICVLVEPSPGKICALGEVPVQADGSFMAEVPANVPLGFEALDENGEVLWREAPMFWLRPGENRSCIGCHEPRNRSPHNHRPLAVNAPVPRLSLPAEKLAEGSAAR